MPRQERTKSGTGIYHVMLGMKNNGTFGAIDNLTISYNGNQLVKVTDAAEALNYSDALDFHDGDDTACEYDYDNNGALTRDSNRGIKSIAYDYAHYPSYINMSIGKKIRYVDNDYTADGRKLSSKHKAYPSGNISVTTTDLYIDGLMLRNDAPLLWRFDGGYVDLNANGTPTRWNYYIADHLGSTRMVADANKGIAHIDYDNLNYPKRIQFTNGNTIEYVYAPDGQKLRATYQTAAGNVVVPLNTTQTITASTTSQTDYIGNVILSGTSSGSSTNVTLDKFLFAGGYTSFPTPTTSDVHYYTQDHLGNNRSVVNESGTVEQVTHYYPFGGVFADAGTGSSLQPYKYNGKELDRMHGLDLYDYGARHYDAIVPMFTQVDPLCEKYYNNSPYTYCAGDPVRNVDPNGMEIYMLFYTSGNDCGDEMFQAAAETRKYDIEHSDYFDSANDIVLLILIQDLASISQLVRNIVDTYSENFGKTAEFSIWSHAGLDGPTGTVPTSTNAIYKKQMSIEGWGNIDFNWGNGATANFYGCKTGVGNRENASFATRVSSNSNFRDVTVYGQTTSAYPSIYTNVRQNTQEMMNGNFSYPTYMVGGNSLGIIGRFFPTFSRANPMRGSTNGKSVVHNYYQQGRRF